MIVKAASSARMQKKNCRQFARHLKMIGNFLPNLKRRNILNPELSSSCNLYTGNKEESISHLFFECQFTSKVWFSVLSWLGLDIKWRNSMEENLKEFAKVISLKHKDLVHFFAWVFMVLVEG